MAKFLLGLAVSILVLVIISIIIIIYLFYTSSKNYKEQELFSQLKIELLLSCFLHQISFIPFFTNEIKNKPQHILCYMSVILNLSTMHSTLLFGLAIPYILYQMIKNAQIEEKKAKHHLIISTIIWVLSIAFSIIIFENGNVILEHDSICWFSSATPNYILSGTTCVLNVGIIISFCLLRNKIKKDLKEISDPLIVNKYISGISYFFYFIILSIISPFIELVRFFFNEDQYYNLFLIIEDIILCLQFTIIPIIFCFNKINATKYCSLCCEEYIENRTSGLSMNNDLSPIQE